jgi:hypothetical protein
MNTAAFLERALSARAMPKLYWLGKGGWSHDESAGAGANLQPGRAFDLARELEQIRTQRPEVHAAYLQGLQALEQQGVGMAALPRQACDCSGFVCWALGIARDSAPWGEGGWLGTDAIYADALGPQRLFKLADNASPGVLVVYPKPNPRDPKSPPGHIGIVTAVGENGSAARVLHCAPDNILLAPPADLPRNAIAETDMAHFDAVPATRLVVWRGLDAAAG